MRKIYFLAFSILASASLMATQVKVAVGTDLQAAVDGASSGDTVLVEAGTYEGNFTMKDGVYVSGGWNADFTAQTEHTSILDAKANGRVLNQPKDFTTLTIWDNFTIQNGKLTVALADQLGAGVALLKNGRVINCLVQNNTFTYDPATQCAGGGIAQNCNGDTCAINCIVRNNKATHGGGIRTAGVAINCIIENNEAAKNGGGVYLHSIGQLHNSIVRNNVSKADVGGVDIAGVGGAVYNCLIVGNHADGAIGGVQARKYNNVVSTTIVGNSHNTTTADRISWAGFRASDNTPTNYNGKLFVNNVIWGNKHNGEVVADQVMSYLKHYASNGTFANNALQGTANVNATYIQLSAENDPQFGTNYECAATSPLYNAGSNEALTYLVGDKDVYGNARKQNGAIEIGAVESITKYYVAAGTNLQAAVDGASSGDTVLVEEGIYEGNFTMKDGVYVSGGWNADFTAQTEHASTLDAKQNGRVLNQPDNFETLTIWDNFKIQNGKLTAIQSDKLGSGVALMKKGRVINCLIQNNTFDYSGNCMGGGIGQDIGDNKDTCAINCVVRDNKATHGGGVRIRGVILNSLVESNVATKNGGGIYLQGSAAAYNCVILKNTCAEGGGGVDTYGSARMVGCLIAENTAGNVGGIQMRSLHRDTVDSGSDIINCTVVNNKQTKTNNPQFCGVRLDVRNNPSRAFINNVVWGNTVNGEAQTQEIGGYPQGYGTFLNNAFAGTTANVTYIQLNAENDPQFDVNYECAATSPLYNAGSNAALTYLVGDKDVYGNARKQNGAIEIGAVESITKYYVAAGTDLQTAVDGASSGDTVLVQAGTYEGNFTMRDGVYVSGGWNADFTAQTEHTSILDAKANGRVLNQPDTFNTLTIWDNFTIQNGKLTAAGSQNLGSGVALMPKGRVINCLIQNNTFDYSGNCLGGGIGQESGNRNDTCAINCIVRNNVASHGGGVRIRGVILNSIIEENTSTTNAGGGMHLQAGAAYNCIIRNNESLTNTGGVRCYGTSDLVNCLIVGNKAGGKVGGVGCESKPSNIINCTIVGNEQVNTGSDAVYCGLSDGIGSTDEHKNKLFVNNIVWGNKAGGEVQVVQANSHIKRYSTFKNNALSDTTNLGKEYFALAADNAAASGPQFGTNYECAATSPLYNAGSNAALTYLVGDKDVYGNARVQNGAIEIGAVECAMALLADGDNSVVIEANKDMKTNVLLKRTFKANDGYYTICLPFDIAASEIGQAFQVKSILDAGAEGFNVEFKEVEELEAGEPYLIKPKDLTNPVFENVTIKTVSATANEVTGAGIKVAFTGVINGGGETNGTTEYWVGNGGYLYNNKTAKLGLRAFFTITDAEGNPTKVRARVVTSENETAGFENITIGAEVVKTIENGQLIIICSGEKYNAQGVRL